METAKRLVPRRPRHSLWLAYYLVLRRHNVNVSEDRLFAKVLHMLYLEGDSLVEAFRTFSLASEEAMCDTSPLTVDRSSRREKSHLEPFGKRIFRC